MEVTTLQSVVKITYTGTEY